MARVKDVYTKDVIPKLKEEFSYSNPHQIPKIEKIVINIGMGEAVQNVKVLDSAVEELGMIAGQRPVITKARKSIAGFKLREGMPIGCMVTLRGDNMYAFYDKLVGAAIPRIRDFRGLSPKCFDGRGNYTLGIKEHIMFPDIELDKIDKIKGMNVTIVTTAKSDAEGRSLLTHLGMPFRK
jgi:large subunit ribosomal protein L5